MGENNYIFGFDIGIGSTGVAVISDDGNLAYDGTHVFHCNINLPEAKICNDEECNFFKEFLK